MNAEFWLCCSLILLIFEVLCPGTFIGVFFSLGSLGVSFLVWQEFFDDITSQLLAFTILSGGLYFSANLQSSLVTGGRSIHDLAKFAGERGLAIEPISSSKYGLVELHGVRWKAQNIGRVAIKTGDQPLVMSQKGVMLEVMIVEPLIHVGERSEEST